ncbi:MAG: ATP-binding protein, partial [Bacteroidota bacterium]
GTIHGKLNQFEKSFDAFNKSIKILEEVGNKNKLAYTLMLAGNEYSKIDQKKAMEQYQKAIEIYKSVGNKKEIAKCQMNIGRLLYNQGNMASAFVKFQQVVDMLQSLNDLGSLSGLYNEVGNLYLKQRNKGKAISYYSRGATFGEEGNNFEKAGLCHRKLAEIYMEEGNTLKAKPHVEAAVGFGEKANKPELLRDAYYLTYQLKKQQQNHADALYYFEKYTQLNELTGENTRLRQINEFKIRNKEKELKTIKQMMENQGRIQAVKLNQQRNVIIFLIIISLLVIAIIMVLYNQYNIKKKSEAELALLNSTKDKFFSIIAHDIKNPLGGMVGMTQAIERDKNIDPEKMREANSMVNASAKHLYTLLENLLQWARSQTQRIKYSPSAINVKPLLEETASLFKSSASDKNILLSVLLEKDYIVFADKEMITTVARNLISNAIKFTQGGGHVSIDAKIVQDKLIIYIKDTGVGMHPEEKQKLFRLDVHHTTRGTHNEEGTGLGLILCKEFVEKNRGEINVESEKGKGTVFSFTLPLYD